MSIKTEYRGYTISYSENADEWNCYECGVSNASLSKVKAKIDGLHLKMRKASAVECFELSGFYSEARVTQAVLVDYLGPRVSRSGSFGLGDPVVTGHKIAAMAKRDRNERASRREGELSDFAPNTPEAQAAIEAWIELKRLEAEAKKRAEAAFNAIPRLQLSDIQGLVKASTAKIEEDA